MSIFFFNSTTRPIFASTIKLKLEIITYSKEFVFELIKCPKGSFDKI